jgi:hypothetical protein
MGVEAGGTTNPSIQARNFIIACYAVSLTKGETLKGRRIRHATLRGYVQQAIACHTSRKLPSPTMADMDYIKTITEAVRKYEKVPNRREMIHDAMFHFIIQQYKKFRTHSPDALVTALCEWLVLGRYVGFRSAEWCHESPTTYKRIVDEEWGDRPDSLALILGDFSFATCDGTPFTVPSTWYGRHFTSLPSPLHYTTLEIRKQKNNDNGATLTYAKHDKNCELCPTLAALNIVCRGHRLGLPSTHPAAVYSALQHKLPRLITARDANNLLRHSAQIVFKMKKGSKQLDKWSTHSIRVTACNLLHRARYSDTYIKNRLRWKSDAFLMYLRNTFYTADEHSKSLSLDLAPPAHRRPLEAHNGDATGDGCGSLKQ